jgi:hypothetical protein
VAPEEVEVEGRGGTWIARVLGRTGGSPARAAPLLLVGFWERGSAAAAPSLECMLPARRLADVPEEALQSALDRAKPPRLAGHRPPFFEDADATRRPGGGGEY